jgi:hypothetical protein
MIIDCRMANTTHLAATAAVKIKPLVKAGPGKKHPTSFSSSNHFSTATGSYHHGLKSNV